MDAPLKVVLPLNTTPPTTVPPVDNFKNNELLSTYCFVAACKLLVGLSLSVKKPVIVSPALLTGVKPNPEPTLATALSTYCLVTA